MSYVGFYERITLDVLRLLKGNTRAQIRNTVFEIIVKMLRDQIDRNGLPGNPHVVTQKIKMRMPGFDQPLEASLECQHLEVHLNTLILPAADSIIQETFATNPSANQLPRKAFENTMKILSMMVRAEHLLHKWITSRMLNHFPMEHGNVNIELDVVIINLRFAKLYAKSYRSTYNHPNAVEPVLRQRIEDYVIKVFTEQGRPRGIEGMELAVKTVVAVKSMGLDLFKYVVNYLERTRFTDRKKLGVLAAVFKYLERDSDESSKIIINFAMDNMTNILDQLLKQVPEASSCDLTLDVLRSALRCCNTITRTHIFRSPNKQWDFYQQLSLVLAESIAIISLLPVSFQQEVFSVIFVLPPQWLQPMLNKMQPDILDIWEAGAFDTGFMQKFITAIPGQINTLEFAMKVLFRPSDLFRGKEEEDYKNIEEIHDAIYYCLIAAEKDAMIKKFVEYEIEEYRMFEYSPEHISIWLTLARARIYGCESHESLLSLPNVHILRVAANFMIEFEKKSVVKNFVEKYFRYERILPFLKAYTTETEGRMNKWCDYVSRLARNREVCNLNCLKAMLKLHGMKKEFADKPFYMVCQRELEVIINQTNDDEVEW